MKGNSKNENELLMRLSKTLTSVSPASRKKGLDIITRYISKHNNSMTRLQMLKIWKGLYYSMWLSDKVLIQREIAVNISQLQRMFEVKECFFLFIEEFYLMMRFRWDGMDHYRMDKFTFLQRTMLAESLDILSKKNFDPEFTKGLFNIYRSCLFDDNIGNEKLIGKKRKFFMIDDKVNDANEVNSTNESYTGRSTGIGISLIFCKQFPQELVYLLYEQYKLINKNSSNSNLFNKSISSFLNEYAEFITNIIKSCTVNSTLSENIYSQLILKLFDFDLLFDQVICDIENLNIDQEERNLISCFLSDNMVNLMSILQSNLSVLSKSNDSSITQSKRNNIYSTLEKIGTFLKNNTISSNKLPKVSKNKKKILSKKLENVNYEGNYEEDKEKRVRFDMSKNVRMLLPDSISTSRALVKIFDKKNDVKGNNELNCILFRSSPDSDLQNTDQTTPSETDSYNLGSLKNIEIISAEKALSKPSESSSSPSKSILKRRGVST
ncbi:nucleolar protein NOP52 [Cryptosporidium ubiquitum]|uniref:Nucleolar protein NOP52 n=1 Tax=Cryptosporidium ubiquitum TaxID=857276 RepID=A0A1J4MCS7_9CRYT|nr:nucleolar protein NOP52 [Cryptosporidium ubiquitum]OII72022.1 nucleolar protein NOP52 [Cryptosporidium ubiquitum]